MSEAKKGRKYPLLKDQPRHAENPFMKGFTTKTTNKTRISKFKNELTDTTTGEIHDSVYHIVQKEVPSDQFVQIYVSEMKSMFDLTKSAQTIFWKVLEIIQSEQGSDRIMLHPAKYWDDNFNMPNQSYYNGLGELIAKEFLAQGELPNSYYFNPRMVFNGQRATFAREYVIKQEKAQKELPELEEAA